MSQLYIIHNNKTAGVYLEGNPWLKRYINMDTGKISFTTGTRVGGRPINPEGKLGKYLIKTAEEWINNPNTVWHDKVVWRGIFHDKYPPFNSNNRLKEIPKPTAEQTFLWFILSIIIFLFLVVLTIT